MLEWCLIPYNPLLWKAEHLTLLHMWEPNHRIWSSDIIPGSTTWLLWDGVEIRVKEGFREWSCTHRKRLWPSNMLSMLTALSGEKLLEQIKWLCMFPASTLPPFLLSLKQKDFHISKELNQAVSEMKLQFITSDQSWKKRAPWPFLFNWLPRTHILMCLTLKHHCSLYPAMPSVIDLTHSGSINKMGSPSTSLRWLPCSGRPWW